MSDFVTALALVFVIEGALYALFPGGMRRSVAMMMEMSDVSLRVAGLIAAAGGVLLVWLIRG